jgi:phosphoribosyl-ATP pyrophosphohydrolase
MNPSVKYCIISDAERFYETNGFTPCHLPWAVDKQSIDATIPPEKTPDMLGNMYLVGSAEQAFVQEIREGRLDNNKCYVSTTPCFRQEPVLDKTHFRYFMKTELFCALYRPTTELIKKEVERFLTIAYRFFSRYLQVSVVTTVEGYGYDIVSPSNVELGSYGYRTAGDLTWIFGTGVAEPRLSDALPKLAGYHIDIIPKEPIGTAEKVMEEALELVDACKQANPVMALVEMSDLLGAVQLLLESKFGGALSVSDLITMAKTTRRAFESNRRPPRSVPDIVIPSAQK